MVCHRFCPQALAEALKVNKTVTNIDLFDNKIGNEGAKAWCLARGSVAICGSWPPNGEMESIKMESSGVPVVFETCETLVLLEGYSGVGPVHLSKRVIEMGWKQDEKWDGGVYSDTCKTREKFQFEYQSVSCFGGNLS